MIDQYDHITDVEFQIGLINLIWRMSKPGHYSGCYHVCQIWRESQKKIMEFACPNIARTNLLTLGGSFHNYEIDMILEKFEPLLQV